MDRFRELDLYQKGIILLLIVLMVVFLVVYCVTISKTGFLYRDVILVPDQVGGNAVYSGQIMGQLAEFTVTPNLTVTFRWGTKIYGPYTVRENPSAAPKAYGASIGYEVKEGEEIIFRGGIADFGGYRMLIDADGTPEIGIVAVPSNGTAYDSDGKVIDVMEPSAMTLIDLVEGPELTHKGHWGFWFCSFVLSIVTILTILFADEIFRWDLSFRIQDVYAAEPSDWEIIGRYIGWTAFAIAIFVIYQKGLG